MMVVARKKLSGRALTPFVSHKIRTKAAQQLTPVSTDGVLLGLDANVDA